MGETTMKVKTVLGVIGMMLLLVNTGYAEGKGTIQEYFNDTAIKVKATAEPAQKREILDQSFRTMFKALDRVESSGLITKDDRAGVENFKTTLLDKQNELMGSNGYERVSDAQLDAFSDYVVQDMEQAAQTVTIGVVTALLIVIIIILLVA